MPLTFYRTILRRFGGCIQLTWRGYRTGTYICRLCFCRSCLRNRPGQLLDCLGGLGTILASGDPRRRICLGVADKSLSGFDTFDSCSNCIMTSAVL